MYPIRIRIHNTAENSALIFLLVSYLSEGLVQVEHALPSELGRSFMSGGKAQIDSP